ncbi:MAG: MBL fold metallo-hydrolase [Promethearchaeota archaeon]
MIKIEILLLTNNCVVPFQNIGLEGVYLNKLFATQSLAEHGLGFLITISEVDEKEDNPWETDIIQKIVFDVGGSNKTYLHNLNVRGYSLYDVNSVALSHWHYDHTGAIYEVLEEIEEKVPIICHQDAEYERFFKRSRGISNSDLQGKKREEIVPLLNEMKMVNQPPIDKEKIEKLNGNLIYSKVPYLLFELGENKIILSGEIPRNHPEEDFKDFFSLQGEFLQEDKILDDKCMIIELENNVILLNGCCHSGIMNTLDYVKNLTKKPISHIIGGFHMASATDKRVKNTIQYLKNFQEYSDTLYLFPIHCTGEYFLREVQVLKDSKLKAYDLSVGTIFNF